MKILQGVTFVAYLCLALCCGVVVYKVHQQVMAVERWVEAIDGTLAKHAVIIQKQGDAVHRLIDRLKPGQAPGESPSKSENPAKVATVQDAALFETGKPMVLMYCSPGCEPCERWWRDKAPVWLASGYAVKRKQSASTKPTPYFVAYNGEAFFEFDDVDSLELFGVQGK